MSKYLIQSNFLLKFAELTPIRVKEQFLKYIITQSPQHNAIKSINNKQETDSCLNKMY